uniref:NADH-ubiquinone oxidoreductase chain 1 n=1 Tax=Angomonas deanei TaxID=59799 RepID=A0A077EVP0_9TRYP|nr:NADH dehydrogenase subunit 1 [Angomonas deanei]
MVVLVMNGYVSLCERRVLAIVQIRVGPALFLFGILTPITDGVKLFVKFVVFVVSFDIFYFICFMFGVGCCMFVGWFFFPIGFIVMLDSAFTLFLMMILHLCSSILGTVCVGCFLFSSCFVYLSAVRTLFFSIITESVVFLLFICTYMLDMFSFFGIKDVCIGQLYLSNFYIAGVLFVGVFWVTMLLDGMKLPFDYTECESELVCGLITELSGVFFVIYSVLEISHLLLTTVLIASLCFGGLFVCFKAIIILVVGFFYPRVVGFRIKITTAQAFIILFLFFITLFMFLWISLTKILCILY